MARGGKRVGAGRKVGSLNKATIARNKENEELIEQTAARHDPSKLHANPLAKEIVEQFMLIAAGYASKYQPGKPDGNEAKFKEWAKLAVEWAAELAPFQSPKFKAIVISGAPAQKIAEFAKDARVQLEYIVAREIEAESEAEDAFPLN